MCLQIKLRHRNIFTGKWKPKVLKKDLVVCKVLRHTNDGIITPYFKKSIRFNELGVCKLKAYSEQDFTSTVYVNDINRLDAEKGGCGYHAYLKPEDAYNDAITNAITNFNTFEIHLATIPAGSLVYFGKFGDICANQMLIYENQ